MYCPKCGKELPEGAYFCPNCGNSVISPPTPSQTEDSPSQDISATEQQVKQQSTPPVPQQSKPPIPDEEVKCPKCGATGCVPQYKQNVSGGGYGCCQGVLGSLILGPLGLLCGACGRSVKTSNNLVWICPKCGHEFKKPLTKEEMKKKYGSARILSWCSGLFAAMAAFCVGCTIKGESDYIIWFSLCILAAAIYAFGAYTYCPFSECTEEQKQRLKKDIVIMGIITGIFFLLSILVF